MRILLLTTVALAAAYTGAATAATVIETQAGPARAKSLMTVEEGKARMQSEPNNYILIDSPAGLYLYVIPENQEIVKMNSAPPVEAGRGAKATAPVPGKLIRKGAGPRIAGFATQRYELRANGQLCVTTYLSRDAMLHGQVKDFLAGFHRLQAQQKQQYRKAGTAYAPCDDAQETLMGRYPELGLAMRTIGADGQLLQEVVGIQTGVNVSGSFFAPPHGFRQLTHEEFLRKMEGGGAQDAPAPKAGEPVPAPAIKGSAS